MLFSKTRFARVVIVKQMKVSVERLSEHKFKISKDDVVVKAKNI